MQKQRTIGEALADPTTNIAKAAAQTAAAREQRIAKARELAEREGITLEEAIQRIWGL